MGHVEIEGERICTLLAKAGHKIIGSNEEQMKQIEAWMEDDSIRTNTVRNLSTLKDIFNPKSSVDDLVMVSHDVKVNVDYDFKRKLNSDGTTSPFRNIDEMTKYRGSANYLRNVKKQRASASEVAYCAHLAKQNVRRGSSPRKFAINHFLRALVQQVSPFVRFDCSYEVLSEILRDDGVSASHLKNAKRFPFKANVIANTGSNRKLIRGLLKALNYEDKKEVFQKFFDILIFKEVSQWN
jgi:hypothetical protein